MSAPISPTSAQGPVFDFFNGQEFLAPSLWAGAKAPDGTDATWALRSLAIAEVLQKEKDSSMFADGVRTHPQWDPTPNFVEDLPAIMALAKAPSWAVTWAEPDRDGYSEGYSDTFDLPDGTTMEGILLSKYLLVMSKVIEAGALADYETSHSFSDALLWFGFHAYSSSDHASSGRHRSQILSHAWRGAFLLKAARARQLDNESDAERWERMSIELDEAVRFARSYYLDKIQELIDGG
jgi:hypothetical protein